MFERNETFRPTLMLCVLGDLGWLVSASFGASATFEYKAPTLESQITTTPAEICSVVVKHGDCLFLNGAVLEHRIAAVHANEMPERFRREANKTVVRLNLQIRKFGVSDKHTFNALSRTRAAK